MPYCYQCGCQVDAGVSPCPACHTPIIVPPGVGQDADSEVAAVSRYPAVTLPDELPARRKVWLFWRMVTLMTVVTLGVMGVADAMGEVGMDWSLLAMPSVLTAWWLFSTVLWFHRHAGLLVAVQAPAVVGCLALLDMANGQLNWFLPLGLPITGIVSVYALCLWLVRRGVGCRWPAVIWVALILVVPVCIGFELLIETYRGQVRLRWSLVVSAVLLPIAVFLAYFNVYLRRYRIDLWRYLHTS